MDLGKWRSAVEYDAMDKERYGVGAARRVDDFFALFGVDRGRRTISKDLCEWSTSGKMHRQFTKYMRPDKKGIDYDAAIAALGLEVE